MHKPLPMPPAGLHHIPSSESMAEGSPAARHYLERVQEGAPAATGSHEGATPAAASASGAGASGARVRAVGSAPAELWAAAPKAPDEEEEEEEDEDDDGGVAVQLEGGLEALRDLAALTMGPEGLDFIAP